MFLDRRDDALSGELAETIRHTLLLVVQSAKHIGIFARIQKLNDVCALAPIVLGVQVTLLDEVATTTPTKALIKRAPTLLWMRLNQDAIVHESRMMRRDQ